MTPPPVAAASRRDIGFLMAAAASWGIGTVVSKQAVAEVPPLTLLAFQLAISVAFLAVIVRARRERLPDTREGRLLGRLGLLNPGLAYALSLIGLTEITASLSVLLWAGEPILILALAAVVLGDRLGPPILVASLVAVVGLVLVVLDPAASGSPLGIGLTVAGVVACAVYSVATRRWLLGSDSTFGVVFAQELHALGLAVVVVAGLGLAGGRVLPEQLTFAGLVSAAVSGLLYYAVAYSFYISALRSLRVSIAAASFYLIPLFGLAAAWLAGERLQPIQWLGAAFVVAAVAVITTRSARQDAVTAPAAPPGAHPSRAASSAQMATTPSEASRS